MPRNREGFSEFQIGLLRTLANELEGEVVFSLNSLDSTPLVMVMNQKYFPILRWIYGEEPAMWTGREFLALRDNGMTINGFIRAIRDLKEDDNG